MNSQKISNPFRNAKGKPVNPFTMEAEAWDMCLDSIKRKGFYINSHAWESDIPEIVRRLRKGRSGYLHFIPDETQQDMP